MGASGCFQELSCASGELQVASGERCVLLGSFKASGGASV